MKYGRAGNAPALAESHVVVVYEPADGRVKHLHHVMVLEGGKRITREEAETEARDNARRSGHDLAKLRVHYVDGPLPEDQEGETARGTLHIDTTTGQLVRRTSTA